jgi:hypothetical protein
MNEATTVMANTPKKMKDPTEAALSAIQDALKVRDPDAQTDAAAPATQPVVQDDDSAAESSWRSWRSGQAVSDDRLDEERQADEPSQRRAANDDRESIGQILRALQRRPSRTSYLFATIFALAWLGAGFGLGWLYLPDLQSAIGPTGLTTCSPTSRGARRNCG